MYQIEPGLLKLLRSYGTDEWEKGLKTYLASQETLAKRYAQEREMKRIPITVAQGKTITLSPGGQNVLVKAIIEDFCQLFTAEARDFVVFSFSNTLRQFRHLNLQQQQVVRSLLELFAKNGTSRYVQEQVPQAIQYIDRLWTKGH